MSVLTGSVRQVQLRELGAPGRQALKLSLLVSVAILTFSSRLNSSSINQRVNSLPILFEQNRGQVPPGYRFLSRHGNVEALFSNDSVEFVLSGGRSRTTVIEFCLVDAQPGIMPVGNGLQTAVSHYLVGADPARWERNIPNYSQVLYPDVYPGIDLVFHGSGSALEHDFRVAAGADPRRVRFSIRGSDSMVLDPSGNLVIRSANGNLVLQKPTAYQESSGRRQTVEASFVRSLDGAVGFQLGTYDRGRELVIDPVFVFSTYLAGSSADNLTAVTTDLNENIYLTGFTSSKDFPAKGGLQEPANGSPMAFVSKLDPTGSTLLYSTYLGGSARNYGNAIAVDGNGNIIVAGTSSSNDFPHAGSVPAFTCQGNNDCYFLASLRPDGSSFNYSGLVGGIEGTAVQTGQSGNGCIAVDPAGNTYLAGVTDDPYFELTTGTLTTAVPGYPYNSTFVLKVSPTGALLYSTIIPGNAASDLTIYLNNVFIPAGISLDANGQAAIAGTAGPGLPTTAGVVQPAFSPPPNNQASPSNGFILRLNASASVINYATYVPGTDSIGAFAVDKIGNSYLTGATYETSLPVSSNAYQKTRKAVSACCSSGFVLKLNSSGTAVEAGTYLDGTDSHGGTNFTGIALDSNSNVYVGGMTGSEDFPLVDPFVSLWVIGTYQGDMVIAEMNPDLSSLLFSTFLSSIDQILPASVFSAIATDHRDHPIVIGETLVTDFPTTPGSFQPTPPNQSRHGFIAKLDMTAPAPSVCLDRWSVGLGSVAANQSARQTVNLTNCGNAPLLTESSTSSASTVSVEDGCGTLQAGASCIITLTYSPVDSSPMQGTLTLLDNAAISPQVIQFFGQGVAATLYPSTAVYNFGHVLVNTSGGTNELALANLGNAPLVISSISILGSEFSLTENDCTVPVPPHSGCLLKIAFSPVAAGIRTGILTVVSNDPQFPQVRLSLTGTGDAAYALPVISSLGSPTMFYSPTAQIGTGPITIWVNGWNFYPGSVVMVNGIAQQTTLATQANYPPSLAGRQQLRATLTSDVTNTIGEISVTVANPAPGGGTSVPVALTLYELHNIDFGFLTSVPGSPLLYGSVPASAPANPNTVIAFNPGNGVIGTPIPVGNNPGQIAASSDGSYLFVVARQDQTIQRINLSTKTVDRTFPFPPNATCPDCGPQTDVDLKGVPGAPQEVILALQQVLALYNDQGIVNYVPSSSIVFAPTLSSFAYAGNPLTIYSLPFSLVQNSFFNIFTLGAQGLGFTPLSGANYGGNNTTGAQVASDGTLLYTNAGQVWNPTTQTQVGSFPVTTFNATSYPNQRNFLMDLPSGRMFIIGDENYETSASLILSAYDQGSLGLIGILPFPQLQQPFATSLVRWGTNGFAFLTEVVTLNGIVNNICVFTSSLAGASTANALPQIGSINPSSLPQGSPITELTLNGQGFTAGSTVKWNGTTLQSFYEGSSVLRAIVPDADLAQSGSVAVTVTNPAPGGGTSTPATFLIMAPAPLAAFSSSSVSFANQAIGTSSAAQTVAFDNLGTASLSIASISVTGPGAGSFQQTNSCGSSLAAAGNCVVSVVFTPVGSGSSMASLIVVDDAVGSPHTVTLSGISQSVGLGPSLGGSTSATVSAGGIATYSLTIGGLGLSGTATVTCSGAPQGTTCSVPATVNLSATSPSTLTVSAATTSRTSGSLRLRPQWTWALVLFALCGLPGMNRARTTRWGTVAALWLLSLICSCGGGSVSAPGTQSNPNGTPAGTYTLTVTATVGSNSQSLPLTLKVQ